MLGELGQLIFLDRYAQKDHDRAHLKVGQRVVVCPDTDISQRFLARLDEVDSEAQAVEVTLEQTDETILLPWDQVDLPVEGWADACLRVSGAVAANEKGEWAEAFEHSLLLGQLVPAGRIWAGAGVQEFLTAFNCFVIPPPHDSRSGITTGLNQLTEIMSRGGGVGIPLMTLRPKYAFVKGVNGRSSGSVCWSELYAFATKLIEQGGCLSELCNVLTDKGFVPAGELCWLVGEQHRVWTHEGWKAITNRWDKGIQDVYRVKTKRGYQIDLTLNHKVLRLTSECSLELVPLEEVREGDTLALLPGSRPEIQSLPLDVAVPKRSKRSSRNKSYDLPAVLDDRLAWLVGYFAANGSVRGRSRGGDGIRLTVPDAFPKDLQRVRSLLKELFGYEANPLIGSGACKVLEVTSVQIEDFLRQSGLLKERSSEAFVPELVKQSGMSQVEHFLAGCFAGDGCFSGEQPYYSTSCQEFARELQDLLLSVGVPSWLDGRGNESGDTWWILSFPGKRAQERLVEIMDGRAQRVEGFECSTMERSWSWPANLSKSGIPPSSYRSILNSSAPRTSVRAVGRILENLGDSASDELRLLAECLPAEVESIQRIGEARTYDFEVEGVHKLWVDGFYVSNSRQGALMLMHYDWHPDVLDFIDAKRDGARLTGANLSVAVSDELMEAIERDEDWDLIFPETDHSAYDTEWDGDIHAWKGKGYPVRTYKTLKARELWQRIVKAAHASAEPGLFFVGRYNKMSNSFYYEKGRIFCTNPCFSGSTRLATQHGMVPISELSERALPLNVTADTRVLSESEIDSLRLGVELREAVPAFRTSDAETVFTVELRHGFRVTATGYHEFVTPDGRSELKDLQVGDTVLIQSAEGQWGSEGSPDLGAILGWMTGDGWWSGKGEAVLRFYGKKQDVAPSVLESAVRLLPDGYTMNPYSVGSVDATEASSTALAKVLAEYGFHADTEGSVPEVVWRGTRDTVRSYLRLLFAADGQVNASGAKKSKTCSARLSQSNPDLLREVQLLLLNFGIVSALYKRREAGTRRLPDGKGGLKGYYCKAQFDLCVAKENLARFAEVVGFVRPEHADAYSEWAKNRVRSPYRESFEDEIVSIEEAGIEPVFCTTQPSHHTVIANGFVTGQCGEQGIPAWSVCNLGHVNLSRLLVGDGVQSPAEFDWAALEKTVRLGVRFLDNVIDIARVPFTQQQEQQAMERRIGLGTLGLGEALIRMHVRYGDNPECLKLIDKLYGFICVTAYDESVNLAIEKGPFPACDPEKLVQSGFIKTLPSDLIDRIAKHGLRNVTVLTQAPTGCVAPETLISVDGGLQAIEGLGDPTGSTWQPLGARVCTDNGEKKADKFYVNGYKPVRTLTTARGFTLTATEQHRVRVLTEEGEYAWREMENIVEGDVVCLKRGSLARGAAAHLTSVDAGNRAVAVLPSEMTVDLAEVVGYYMGNGYLKDRGGIHLVVPTKSPDLQEYLRSKLSGVFGNPHVGVEDREGCSILSMTGYHVTRFFAANGMAKPKGNHGEGSAGAFIPEVVLASGAPYVAAFLRGLFEADGAVGSALEYSSVSWRLVHEVQVALLGLGIVSNLRTIPAEQRVSSFGDRPLFSVRVLNRREGGLFADRVGFITAWKQDKRSEIERETARGDSVPVYSLCLDFYEASKGLSSEVRQSIAGRLGNGALNAEFVRKLSKEYPQLAGSKLGELLDLDLFFDVVASVDRGACDTFDISVPETNTYIANGFVSHNTIGTMMATSTGIEAYPWLEWERTGRLGTHREQAAPLRDWLAVGNSSPDLPEWFVSAMDMTPEDHAVTQAAIQRWVDSSISKTSNLPSDYSVDQVDRFYRKMYELGCKGGTVYRDLSRDTQVLNKVSEPKEARTWEVHPVPSESYPMRAVSLMTSVGKLSAKLGYDPKTMEPFEVWLDVSRSGTIMAADREAIARLISLLLRVESHVTPSRRVQLVIDQLQGIQGGDPAGFGPDKVFSVPDAVAKALSRLLEASGEDCGEVKSPSVPPPDICPECHQATVYRADGCEKCMICPWSRC